MSAADIAHALAGRPVHQGSRGYTVPCPLPSHGSGRGDRRPSLSIADGERGLIVKCHGGCDSLDILHELRRRGLLEDRPRDQPPTPMVKRPKGPPEPDAAALAIWKGSKPDGDVVRAYLTRRGIAPPAPPTLRQITSLAFGRIPMPCMVAAVQLPDRRVAAVQRLRLTPDGRKAPVSLSRLTTGALYDGAVRLAAAAPVMGIAEGVETALSAMQLHDMPVWATLGSERLAAVWLPDQVQELIIFADNDAPGLKAAARAAERHTRRGLKVEIKPPPESFGDWNDVLRAQPVEVAA
jgi:hypothetical protein